MLFSLTDNFRNHSKRRKKMCIDTPLSWHTFWSLFCFYSTHPTVILVFVLQLPRLLQSLLFSLPMSSGNKNLQVSTFKDLGRDAGGKERGIFTLRQQLKWVITALKLQTDWALLTCHCQGPHKGTSICREGCTLTLVNWSGASECCDRG